MKFKHILTLFAILCISTISFATTITQSTKFMEDIPIYDVGTSMDMDVVSVDVDVVSIPILYKSENLASTATFINYSKTAETVISINLDDNDVKIRSSNNEFIKKIQTNQIIFLIKTGNTIYQFKIDDSYRKIKKTILKRETNSSSFRAYLDTYIYKGKNIKNKVWLVDKSLTA